jgi:hypothetical protein
LLKRAAALARKCSDVASAQECRQSINFRGVVVFEQQTGAAMAAPATVFAIPVQGA